MRVIPLVMLLMLMLLMLMLPFVTRMHISWLTLTFRVAARSLLCTVTLSSGPSPLAT